MVGWPLRMLPNCPRVSSTSGLRESLGLEGDVERLYAVTLREDEAVALKSLGFLRIQVFHDVEIKGRHHVQARQVTTNVSSLSLVDDLHESFAVLLR